MGDWFVFYVQTGREQAACTLLNKILKEDESRAFIPQVEYVFKNSKFLRKELKPMFPGYVFTDSVLEEKTFVSKAYSISRLSTCIFRLLGNNLEYMKIDEDEKKFLTSFYNSNYIAEESKGFIVGDKTIIASGPLKGKENIIKKIDRHKRRAEIEMTCLGAGKKMNVSLEILSKVPESDLAHPDYMNNNFIHS